MARTTPFNLHQHRATVTAAEVGIPLLADSVVQYEDRGKVHTHPQVQVLGVLRGPLQMVAGRRRWPMRAGSVALIGARVPHKVGPRGGEVSARVLDLRMTAASWPSLAALLPPGGVVVNRVEMGHLQRVAEAIADLRGAPDGLRMSKAAELAWRLVGLAHDRPHTPPPENEATVADPRVRAVEAYLENHLDRPLDLERIGERLHLSVGQIYRLYQRELGVAPMARLKQRRIERARQLLQYSTLSIKQIAQACGFVNPNHFSRVFADEAGQPPTAYRRRALGEG